MTLGPRCGRWRGRARSARRGRPAPRRIDVLQRVVRAPAGGRAALHVAEHDAPHALEGARRAELKQHAVDAVRRLVDVLEEEDRALGSGPERPGRAGGRGQDGEAAAAAAAPPPSPARRAHEVVGLASRRARPRPSPRRGSSPRRRRRRRSSQATIGPWKRHQPEPVQDEVQERDVAVADEHLGVAAQEARRPGAAAASPRPRRRARRRCRPPRRRRRAPCRSASLRAVPAVNAPLGDGLAHPHPEAQLLEALDPAPQPLEVDGAGGRADAEQVPGPQRARPRPAHSSPSHGAAVDGDGGAGDVGGALRAEERDHRRQLLRLGHAAQRHARPSASMTCSGGRPRHGRAPRPAPPGGRCACSRGRRCSRGCRPCRARWPASSPARRSRAGRRSTARGRRRAACAEREAMFTMRPQRRARMWGTAARTRWTTFARVTRYACFPVRRRSTASKAPGRGPARVGDEDVEARRTPRPRASRKRWQSAATPTSAFTASVRAPVARRDGLRRLAHAGLVAPAERDRRSPPRRARAPSPGPARARRRRRPPRVPSVRGPREPERLSAALRDLLGEGRDSRRCPPRRRASRGSGSRYGSR